MKVASFYRFLDLAEPQTFKDELQLRCEEQQLLGTILVAAEGFNGSIAGRENSIRTVFTWIEERLSLSELIEGRWTDVSEAPFRHMRVRLKKAIATLGRPDILPHKKMGTYVPPDLNRWDGECFVFDTRVAVDRDLAEQHGEKDIGPK